MSRADDAALLRCAIHLLETQVSNEINQMSVKLKFRPSKRPDKPGALIYQIIHERKIMRVTSKYRIFNNEWDEVGGRIIVPIADKSRHSVLQQVVSGVYMELHRFFQIEQSLLKSGVAFTCSDIVAEFRKFVYEGSVFNYLCAQIDKLIHLNKKRSGNMLRSTLNKLMLFSRGADLSFAMLTSDLMEEFEAFLKGQGLKRNTTGFYMRQLRARYNQAVEDGLTEDCKPFRKVYAGKDRTIKRALLMKEIKAIKNLDLSAKPHLDYARDMFMFSFYARGMSFVDMAFLLKKNFDGNHFYYSRHKTERTLSVEWVPLMNELLKKYKENDTPYLLPIITDPKKDSENQYRNQQLKINRNLKKVGEAAGIRQNLTMYCSRHSWATIARGKNIPLSVISEALGHDSEKTTQTYLDSIQTSVVDKSNRQILKDL